jgi:two-component system cell cycle sensor histidine kinase/response regulator CckA
MTRVGSASGLKGMFSNKDTNRATVMLVDDEPLIRKSSERMLRHLGYNVILAENGEIAMQLYRNSPDEISLVLLDLLMPVKDGEETFNELIQYDPRAKVILVSGYSQEAMADRLIEKGAVAFVPKPFNFDDIANAMTAALTSP